MKFSENWLRDQVPSALTRAELVSTLTAIGLEVEDVTPLGESLEGVVVAEILSAERHPQADRLQVCSVAFGGAEPVQIVCGAPNARAGLKTVLATVGAVLPGDFTIKPAKLRGVESFGMLCSGKELAIDEGAAGIMELPADAPVGTPLREYLALPDASIEIKLTPNRADCFGIRGIAYDVAAVTGGAVSPLDAEPVDSSVTDQRIVNLQAGADAPRYVGRVIRGVRANVQSPIYMQERLRRSGIKPINLYVDVTAYVMLELGQPMHAFDNDRLQGEIGVRKSRAGESLMLLDGREHKLDDSFLVVTDNDAPIALAGIMGGESSKVSDTTVNLFLEAAHFAPASIMGQGRKLGLHTDASHRFERGVDPELPGIAIEYATRLIVENAGGEAGPVTAVTLADQLPVARTIALRRDRLSSLLGMQVPDERVAQILGSLGLQPVTSSEGWSVTAPTRRFDLEIEEDLIEEVARIYGYDALPMTLPNGDAPLKTVSEATVPAGSVRRQLAARDYRETINYAFVDAGDLAHWQVDESLRVELANPLSAELAVMRPGLLPGLLSAAARNLARQQARVRLFELGNVFTPAGQQAWVTSKASDVADGAPVHTQRVAAVAVGSAHGEQWSGNPTPVDFYAIKGDLESLAALAGLTLSFESGAPTFAHPGRSAMVRVGDEIVGWIGQLHPQLAAAFGVDVPVYGYELDLAPLTQRVGKSVQALSKFPSVRRDLAFVLPQTVQWGLVAQTIKQTAGPLLKELVLFDQYAGKGIAEGYRSLAIGLVLQDAQRTLTDTDVEGVVTAVVAAMNAEFGASIRG
ncbi:phenylalanine--tRNA ligase subunit beta [Luteimonas sp. FXH3W]|uniref:Phenylalanine--tRNA ligase beta subunit n=1 Tax=Aquilutibacter rugosus TaxID=3115820 RepID=A0ABU7V104_9GAMM